MKYQLVIQFPIASVADFDEIVAIEDAAIRAVDGAGVVDGHDAGSGEMNIFVLTDQPLECFERIRCLREVAPRVELMKVAFREVGGERFTVIYPSAFESFSIK